MMPNYDKLEDLEKQHPKKFNKRLVVGLGKSNMVGIKDDMMVLSPLEEAIKGQTEINKDLIRVSEILSI